MAWISTGHARLEDSDLGEQTKCPTAIASFRIHERRIVAQNSHLESAI